MIKLSIQDFIHKYNSKLEYNSDYIAIDERSFYFYGHCFGRHSDITYKIIDSIFDEDLKTLKLYLSQNSKLTIINPKSIIETEKAIIIEEADKILFEWEHFHTKNDYFIKINKINKNLVGDTNIERDFNDLNIDKPAILWQW